METWQTVVGNGLKAEQVESMAEGDLADIADDALKYETYEQVILSVSVCTCLYPIMLYGICTQSVTLAPHRVWYIVLALPSPAKCPDLPFECRFLHFMCFPSMCSVKYLLLQYLDSQISPMDIYYLEDQDLARQLVELGVHACCTIVPRVRRQSFSHVY